MVLWKRKYPSLHYAETQERIVKDALRPVSLIR
jgi:hypothetical protein